MRQLREGGRRRLSRGFGVEVAWYRVRGEGERDDTLGTERNAVSHNSGVYAYVFSVGSISTIILAPGPEYESKLAYLSISMATQARM